MSLKSKENNNSNNNETKKEKEKEKDDLKIICPNAPIITKKPEKKKIPYINVIEDNDSSNSEEDQKEEQTNMAIYNKKDMDDRYNDEDSFDNGFIADQETKSGSVNNKALKKFHEDNPESVS